MFFLRIIRFALIVSVLSFLFEPNSSQAQVKTGTTETIDGVTLKLNVYRGNKGKDGVTVILLHHFDEKGGDANKGWKDLAESIQKAGHTVVSFDFRGYGESTGVDKEKFWNQLEFPANSRYIRKSGKDRFPETISHTDFQPAYYPFLVNDVAAVRAYLDRMNDSGEINTSNIVVIGAGQGATVGALWMLSEFLRRQAVPVNPLLPLQIANNLPVNQLDLRSPEGKDLAAGIFLSMSPTLGRMRIPVEAWLKELGKEQKVPLAFIYGAEDKSSKDFATQALLSINPQHFGKTPVKEFELLKDLPVQTKLFGSQLLDSELPTLNWIFKDYLNKVFDNRLLVEPRTRSFDKFPAFWISRVGRTPVRIKETDMAPRFLPLQYFGINR